MSTTQNELTDNTTPPNSHTYNLENAFGNADDDIGPNSEIFQPNSEEINSDTSANSNTEILNEEEIEDLFTEHRSPASETCLQSVIPEYPVIMEEDDANNYSTRREVCNIALGENDLRWPELFQIIARANGTNMTDEEVDTFSYDKRCRLLNINTVIVAKHYQYRVETFFTTVLLTDVNSIGKIVYYALRIEFQTRGSLHVHSPIWTAECP